MTALLPDHDVGGYPGVEHAVRSLRALFPSYRPGFPDVAATEPRVTPIRPLTYILFGPSERASGKGGDVPVVAAQPVPERRRRVRIVAWSSAWLVVLASPASEIAAGRAEPVVAASFLLGAFVALYLTLIWVSSDPTRTVAARVALLVPLTGIALATSLAYGGTWVFLFFFLSAAIASALPGKPAIFGILGVTLLDAAIVSSLPRLPVVPQVFGVFISGLVVMMILRMLRLIADLNAAREEVARLAVADERLRFSRDLHDLLGHTLSLIVVKSEAVRRLVSLDAEAAARESGDIEMVSRQALAEVREAVTNYRERSLETELEGARLALAAAGIDATIRRPEHRLPDTVETVLGWTVREGVTNVVRHSRGHHCDIELRQADGVAMLEIRDDGTGDTPSPDASPADGKPQPGRAGSGLQGLAERLAAANGRLEAGRHPGGGFRLAATVPCGAEGRGAV
jgi:two-component system sensor histidine kinase DesK